MPLNPEQIVHINVVNWFNYTYPDLQDDFHHFANERFLTPKGGAEFHEGRTLKRMGVKKGVPDFFLAIQMFCDGYNYAGMWLELKVGKNKVTPEQEAFLNRKTARGYHCVACWGFDGAKDLITNYLRNYDNKSTLNIPKNLFNGKPIC